LRSDTCSDKEVLIQSPISAHIGMYLVRPPQVRRQRVGAGMEGALRHLGRLTLCLHLWDSNMSTVNQWQINGG